METVCGGGTGAKGAFAPFENKHNQANIKLYFFVFHLWGEMSFNLWSPSGLVVAYYLN